PPPPPPFTDEDSLGDEETATNTFAELALPGDQGFADGATTHPSLGALTTPASTLPRMVPPVPVAAPHARTLITPPTSPPAAGAGAAAAAAGTSQGFQPQSIPITGPGVAVTPRAALIILDVTPRGLGIATVAGFCEELLRRNSRLPAEIQKLFTTSRDGQDQVRIVVCQGESRRLDANTVIGELVLKNLPRRARGETSIEVTFTLDASGILQVRARDAATGVEQSATLDLVGGIAQQDVAASRDRLAALPRR
nr:Hsp70 family protein [Myxococcota bacterium]